MKKAHSDQFKLRYMEYIFSSQSQEDLTNLLVEIYNLGVEHGREQITLGIKDNLDKFKILLNNR